MLSSQMHFKRNYILLASAKGGPASNVLLKNKPARHTVLAARAFSKHILTHYRW
jgi:hypothetical protein